MRAEIYALFCVTLAAGLLELLLPGSEGSGVKRGMRLLTALAVLLLTVQPLRGLLRADWRGDLTALFEVEEDLTATYEEIFESTIDKRLESDLKNGLYNWLSAEHGVEVKDAQIQISFAEDDSLKSIEITLSGRGLLQDPHVIERALAEKFKCDIEVR